MWPSQRRFFHFVRSWTQTVQFLIFSWQIFCIMKYIHVSWNCATVVDYKFCGFLKYWKWEHIYLISKIGEPVLFSIQNCNCFNFLLLKNSGVFGSVHFWWWWHVSAENYMHVHTQALNAYQNSLVMLRFVDNEIAE